MLLPDPQHPDVRLVVSSRPRVQARVDATPWPDLPDPAIDEAVSRLAEIPDAWGWTLSGGEPTTRSDLPALIEALARAGANNLGLATDGLALTQVRAARSLREAGLDRVRLSLHSGRRDAHDWLANTEGSARRVRRAVAACLEAGLRVEIEALLTRSTAPHLVETVELVAALGVSAIHLRRPVLAAGPHRNAAVAISPRLGTLRPHLEEAVRVASRRGLAVRWHQLPHCAAPRAAAARAPSGSERWLWPADPAWQATAAAVEPGHRAGCSDCPSTCEGAPADYLALFGPSEFRTRPGPRVYAPERPAVGTIRLDLAPTDATRTARMLLVDAVQQRPAALELWGWLEHPQWADLLGELHLLEPEVILVGAVDRLEALPDRTLLKIAAVARIDAALYGQTPEEHDRQTSQGAWDRTLSVLRRLHSAGAHAAAHLAIPGLTEGPELQHWWDGCGLPGVPRLAPASSQPHSDSKVR